MLALCLMLSVTYYAQNYAGIIGWSLPISEIQENLHLGKIARYTVSTYVCSNVSYTLYFLD